MDHQIAEREAEDYNQERTFLAADEQFDLGDVFIEEDPDDTTLAWEDDLEDQDDPRTWRFPEWY